MTKYFSEKSKSKKKKKVEKGWKQKTNQPKKKKQ